jgi:hypothetical protein
VKSDLTIRKFVLSLGIREEYTLQWNVKGCRKAFKWYFSEHSADWVHGKAFCLHKQSQGYTTDTWPIV